MIADYYIFKGVFSVCEMRLVPHAFFNFYFAFFVIIFVLIVENRLILLEERL